MLLRSLTRHVKNQNWFAVWLDFVIVVVGVFVGIQVSNWNDSVRLQALEQSYLSRLAADLANSKTDFEIEVRFADESRSKISQFLEAIHNPSTSDEDLVRFAGFYFTDGIFLADFRPSQATFDDLKATGNLEIIRDLQLREALIALHYWYDDSVDKFRINNDWILQSEDDVYMGSDALRYDARTSALFPEQSVMDSARYLRDNRDLFIRHAALHFWLKDRAVEILDDAIDRSERVLQQIEKAR